jgi:pyruvate dehydrogenase E1 component beta subunit
MLGVCLAAADELATQGVEAEVVDLRTLWPWDRATVFTSVAKTGRLVVAHQAVRVGGFGGEIVAEVSEHLFDELQAPPRRLGAPRVPVPYSEPLEMLCRVSPHDIVRTANAMM